MNYHMGILDDGPSKVTQWLMSVRWDKIPPEIMHDFNVSLMTPGFAVRFWTKITKLDYERVLLYRNSLDPDQFKDEALKNYESITDEDVMKLAKLKNPWACLPLPLAMRVIDDVNNGMTQTEVADKYHTTRQNVHKVVKYPAQNQSRFMPDWFRAMVPGF